MCPLTLVVNKTAKTFSRIKDDVVPEKLESDAAI